MGKEVIFKDNDGYVYPRTYEKVLYNNTAGSNTAITLNDSVVNYQYIEIYYRNNDNFYTSRRFYNPNGKKIILDMCQPNTNNTGLMWTTTMNVSGTSLTIDTARRWLGNTTTNANFLYIIRVIGINIASI